MDQTPSSPDPSGPGATSRWFTFNWPTAWHVVWYVMPTSLQTGAPQLDWDVAVERANADPVHLLDHGEKPHEPDREL